MKVSSNFDSGNIEIVSLEDSQNIQLKINKDSAADFTQWFHFRFQAEAGNDYTIKLINAGETSYSKGWEGYNVCASYDMDEWFRVESSFDGQTLEINHYMQYDSVYFAYFAPYSFERHLKLLSEAQMSGFGLVDLGNTLDGRDFNMLVAGSDSPESKKVWIIARQHPGETMAEWFMEGLIERLADPDDAVSKQLLEKATFYLVPNMNPDGSVRGNLRTNASGANLNREWQTPSLDKSPEVYYVREKMHETGLDMFLDIHGDEVLPYNFFARCEGIPSYTDDMEKNEEDFISHFMSINPDMQNVFGYEKDKPGEGNLTLASNYVGETYKTLALTLEMPFKDNANSPDIEYGWSPERCKRLGASILNSILYHISK